MRFSVSREPESGTAVRPPRERGRVEVSWVARPTWGVDCGPTCRVVGIHHLVQLPELSIGFSRPATSGENPIPAIGEVSSSNRCGLRRSRSAWCRSFGHWYAR